MRPLKELVEAIVASILFGGIFGFAISLLLLGILFRLFGIKNENKEKQYDLIWKLSSVIACIAAVVIFMNMYTSKQVSHEMGNPIKYQTHTFNYMEK